MLAATVMCSWLEPVNEREVSGGKVGAPDLRTLAPTALWALRGKWLLSAPGSSKPANLQTAPFLPLA